MGWSKYSHSQANSPAVGVKNNFPRSGCAAGGEYMCVSVEFAAAAIIVQGWGRLWQGFAWNLAVFHVTRITFWLGGCGLSCGQIGTHFSRRGGGGGIHLSRTSAKLACIYLNSYYMYAVVLRRTHIRWIINIYNVVAAYSLGAAVVIVLNYFLSAEHIQWPLIIAEMHWFRTAGLL